jgi:hypothetical protein
MGIAVPDREIPNVIHSKLTVRERIRKHYRTSVIEAASAVSEIAGYIIHFKKLTDVADVIKHVKSNFDFEKILRIYDKRQTFEKLSIS